MRARRITRSRPRPLSPAASPGLRQQPLDLVAELDLARGELAVRALVADPRPLALARGEHPLADGGRPLPRLGERRQVGLLDREDDVDPVGERAGELRLVGADGDGIAAAVARVRRPARRGTGSPRRPAGSDSAARPRIGLARSVPGRPRAAGAAPRARRGRTPGSSSRKRTPWWASVTSPGRGGVAAPDQTRGRDRVVRGAKRARARRAPARPGARTRSPPGPPRSPPPARAAAGSRAAGAPPSTCRRRAAR